MIIYVVLSRPALNVSNCKPSAARRVEEAETQTAPLSRSIHGTRCTENGRQDRLFEALCRGRFEDARDDRLGLQHDVTRIRMPGNQHHRHRKRGQFLCRGESIHHRHVEIHERDVDVLAAAKLDQFRAILGRAADVITKLP